MASPNKKTLQDINDLLSKIDKAYKKIGESNPFDRSVSSVQNIDKEFKKLDSSLDGLNSRIENLNASFGDIQSQLQAIAKEINPKSFDASKRLQKGLKGVVDQAQKLRFEEEGINRLSQKQLEKIKERAEQEKSNSIRAAKDLTNYSKLWKDVNGKVAQSTKDFQALTDEQKAAVALIEDQSSAMDSIIDKASKRIQQEKEVDKELGFGLKTLGGMDKAFSKLGLPDLGLNKAVEETRAVGVKAKQMGKDFKPGAEFSKHIGKNLKGAVSQANLAQGAIMMLINALMKSDKETGQLAKSFHMSYEEANDLRSELNTIANMSGDGILSDMEVTTSGIQETLLHVGKTLGSNAKLNKEDLVTFTKFRKTAGLTNEELMGTQKLVLGTNKGLKQATGEILAQAKQTSLQNGVLLNEKQILKEIGNVSAATTLSFSKDPKLIAQAVTQAKALGMSLEKVESIASSLLDFESSIALELKAELLTGKELNLEKARQAALNNDLATVATEIAKQTGSAAEFGKMNRIQQEAIAKSVGMSREDLAQTLFTQEQLKGLSEDQAAKRQQLLDSRIQEVGLAQAQRELEEGGIEALEAQNSKAETFQNFIEKIQDAFVTMAPAILSIVDVLMLALEPVMLIFKFIGAIQTGFTKLGEIVGKFIPQLGILGKILRVAASIAIVIAAYKAYASLATIPIIGVPLGVAAAAAVTASGFGLLKGIKKAGDMMSPSGGKTQVSTKEGGLFELSPNDDLVAAPGAADRMKNGGGNQMNIAPLVAKVEQLITINKAILAKSPVIEMGGNEVGQGINTAEREIQ